MNFNRWKTALTTDKNILNFMVIPMLVLDVLGLFGLLLASVGAGGEIFGIFAIGLVLAALLQMLVGATQFIMTILWVSRGSKGHTIYLLIAIFSVLAMFILGGIMFIVTKLMGYGYWIWTRLAYKKVLESNGDDYGQGREDLLDDIAF